MLLNVFHDLGFVTDPSTDAIEQCDANEGWQSIQLLIDSWGISVENSQLSHCNATVEL